MHKKSGFTLIELVIIIILIGILAATSIPKLVGNDGFEAQAYRDQLLQLLKTVQQQAMSCDDDCRKNVGGTARTANPYACNRVVITAERFGIPENCATTLPDAFSSPQFGMSDTDAAATSIEFSVTNTTLSDIVEFSSLGIASGCDEHTLGCEISITGVRIRIEPQGYIHEQ